MPATTGRSGGPSYRFVELLEDMTLRDAAGRVAGFCSMRLIQTVIGSYGRV